VTVADLIEELERFDPQMEVKVPGKIDREGWRRPPFPIDRVRRGSYQPGGSGLEDIFVALSLVGRK
jgi:hypothetical protein